jgi:hypothetical protein
MFPPMTRFEVGLCDVLEERDTREKLSSGKREMFCQTGCQEVYVSYLESDVLLG